MSRYSSICWQRKQRHAAEGIQTDSAGGGFKADPPYPAGDGGRCHVKVDIYFTAVGMINISTEKEIRAMMEEIRNNPQDFKFVA